MLKRVRIYRFSTLFDNSVRSGVKASASASRSPAALPHTNAHPSPGPHFTVFSGTKVQIASGGRPGAAQANAHVRTETFLVFLGGVPVPRPTPTDPQVLTLLLTSRVQKYQY